MGTHGCDFVNLLFANWARPDPPSRDFSLHMPELTMSWCSSYFSKDKQQTKFLCACCSTGTVCFHRASGKGVSQRQEDEIICPTVLTITQGTPLACLF